MTNADLILALAAALVADWPEAERIEHMRRLRDELREQLELPLRKAEPR